MNHRRIDVDKLLELIQGGKTQTECAKVFNVSVAAISKKLKLLNGGLNASTDILEKYNFTEKEKNFVIRKASGLSATQACLETYDVKDRKSAKVLGCQMMQRDDIKEAISTIMNSEGLTRRYRIRKLKQHIDNRDPNVSLKGLDMSFKLDGLYAPEKNINLNVDYTELSERLRELEEDEARLQAEIDRLENEDTSKEA